MTTTCILWATLLSPAAVNRLLSELVLRGCKVSQAANAPSRLMWEGEASTLAAINIEHDTLDRTAIFTLVRTILRESELMVHSLVLSEPKTGAFNWIGSNIRLPAREEKAPEPVPAPAPKSRIELINES